MDRWHPAPACAAAEYAACTKSAGSSMGHAKMQTHTEHGTRNTSGA
jgi:hypothetical protein